MSKKLAILAKELDFTSPYQCFDYMVDSYINGNFSQCKNLFSALKKEDKKDALIYIKNTYNMGCNSVDLEAYNFYFNLI